MLDEGLQRFFAGTFAGKYQDELLAEFDRYLPELPPWKIQMTKFKLRSLLCQTNVISA